MSASSAILPKLLPPPGSTPLQWKQGVGTGSRVLSNQGEAGALHGGPAGRGSARDFSSPRQLEPSATPRYPEVPPRERDKRVGSRVLVEHVL